jgi:type II restriction enzyme
MQQQKQAQNALDDIHNSNIAFAKFLSANDTGLTGAHQCGIFIPKNCVKLIFDEPFEKGANQERFAKISWHGLEDATTESRFIYYGKGTRDEYRITRFGRSFSYLNPCHTGDIFVLCKKTESEYDAYLLTEDDDIRYFLDALGLPPTGLNRLIFESGNENAALDEEALYDSYYVEFGKDFPSTKVMALSAEEAAQVLDKRMPSLSPDDQILRWVDIEYRLFKHIEKRHHDYVLLDPPTDLDSYIQTSLEIINRRKARAGKSLEHHLASIFKNAGLQFKSQATTELNKKPDFIFPSQEAYEDIDFPSDKLVFLAAKTTCKDRWRQILNEANRIPIKYLFTLQPGVSPRQLEEMHAENVMLVVPKKYHHYYPKTEYTSIISLEEFIEKVRAIQKQ